MCYVKSYRHKVGQVLNNPTENCLQCGKVGFTIIDRWPGQAALSKKGGSLGMETKGIMGFIMLAAVIAVAIIGANWISKRIAVA